MYFEFHWFDTSQFVNHEMQYMRRNTSCYYSVRRKGNSTVQATLYAGQPEVIKNKGPIPGTQHSNCIDIVAVIL